MATAPTPKSWTSTGIYTAGMQVTENGITYVANWWTQGNDPAASNGGVGTGQPWTIVTTTPVTPPPAPPPTVTPPTPTGLAAAGVTSTGLTLTWTEPVAANAAPTLYTVLANGTAIGTSTTTSFTVTGLTAATAYRFAVEAGNSAGLSAAGPALAVTTPAATPTPPPTIPAWSASAIYTAGMVITENNVTYKANWWTQGSDPATSNGATGTGQPWTIVTSGSGGGTATPSAPPTTPGGLTVIGAGSNSASLSWTAATVPGGGTPSDYIVYENGQKIATTTSTMFTATGLTASTAYTFSVAAEDAAGASAQTGAVKVTTLAAGTGTPTAGHQFAPYIDMGLTADDNLVSIAQASGIKTFTLAFVQSNGQGGVGWGGVGTLAQDTLANGTTIQQQIQNLRAIGGDVIISFGGAAGTDPATVATSAAALQAEYQSVIDRYHVTSLDFDVEGGALANTAANHLRDQALIGLKAANPGLQISYTVPVLPTGLELNGMNFISTAKADGFTPDVLNIMAMDYGSAIDNKGQMGLDAVNAATATIQQLASVGLASKVGITPMIGMNDVSPEVFTLADAQTVTNFAQSNPNVARLAMWSVARDNGPGGNYVAPDHSGVVQTPYAFSKIFETF